VKNSRSEKLSISDHVFITGKTAILSMEGAGQAYLGACSACQGREDARSTHKSEKGRPKGVKMEIVALSGAEWGYLLSGLQGFQEALPFARSFA